jgi:hypothetical protein
MLYVNNTVYFAGTLPKKVYCSTEKKIRRLDLWKITLRLFKGHGASFRGILCIFWKGIVPARTHCIAPKEDYTY